MGSASLKDASLKGTRRIQRTAEMKEGTAGKGSLGQDRRGL